MYNKRFRAAFFFFLVCLLLSPSAALGDSPTKQKGGAPKHGAWATKKPAEPATLPERSKLENKLQVEQVLVKGRGKKGVEIEVRYRIVDVEGYAAHPRISFVADESSQTMVALSNLQKLFAPAPAEEAAQVPAAVLTFWDKDGVIRPGLPVTVVVAGYGQKHLIPQAGPGYDPQATTAAMPATKPSQLAAPDATLVVHEAKVVAAGHLLRVDFSASGLKKLDPDPDWTYVENPETGKRYAIVKVPRIGTLATRELEKPGTTYMVMDNAGHQIKGGQRINVVVSGVRQNNVLVTEE